MQARIVVASVATVIGLGLVGCATSATAAKNNPKARNAEACVFSSAVADYQPLDNERLVLWAPGRSKPYLLTLSFPSQDLKWGIRVGFEDRDRDGQICGGSDRVIVPDGIPDRISIKSMEKITPDQAKQLIENARMKPPKKPTPEASK